MTDRMKSSATGFFAKTKTAVSRTTQKAMVKMGRAEETIDLPFKQEKDRFFAQYKAIKKMNRDAYHLLQILKDLSIQQNTLADNFYEVYDTKSELYNAALKNQDVSKMLDTARSTLDEQLRGDFTDPVSKYIGQYKEMKGRIEELETRRLDMDRYGRDVRNLQEKGTNRPKLQAAEQKYEAAKVNYTKLHDELMRDLPLLHQDRVPFFDPVLATYLTGLAEFYRQSAKVTQELVGYVSQVNRSSVHDHPRVTTDTEASAAALANKIPVGSAPSAPVSGSSTASSSPTETPTPTAPPPAPPKGNTLRAKAQFDFTPQESNELGFKAGDVITIHSTKGDWWDGEINGKRGMLPSNYVQLME